MSAKKQKSDEQPIPVLAVPDMGGSMTGFLMAVSGTATALEDLPTMELKEQYVARSHDLAARAWKALTEGDDVEPLVRQMAIINIAMYFGDHFLRHASGDDLGLTEEDYHRT